MEHLPGILGCMRVTSSSQRHQPREVTARHGLSGQQHCFPPNISVEFLARDGRAGRECVEAVCVVPTGDAYSAEEENRGSITIGMSHRLSPDRLLGVWCRGINGIASSCGHQQRRQGAAELRGAPYPGEGEAHGVFRGI